MAGGFVWPLARLCVAAFSRGTESHSGLYRLFADSYARRALGHSLALSLVVALASVAICLPAALSLARGRFVGRALLRGVFAIPLALSGVVVGFLAVAMLGNAGALPALLHTEWLRGTAYGLGGLGITYLYFEIPRATLTMEAALATVEDGLLEAARTLGARPRQLVWLVFWPLCAPALRAAFGVTFAASLGSFGVALIIAGRFPLLPVELYRSFTGTLDEPLGAAMALTLALLAIAVLWVSGRRAR
ncbi:MAG: putative Binding-protein-dependent transport system, permease protein [Myxococcales bacterium]|nr:putative Binding-protein-dependent transport system, permease protein [Myxococcales bacterium]